IAGWLSDAADCASRRKRAWKVASLARSVRSRFTATTRPRRVSVPLRTSAIPPRPRSSPSSYRPPIRTGSWLFTGDLALAARGDAVAGCLGGGLRRRRGRGRGRERAPVAHGHRVAALQRTGGVDALDVARDLVARVVQAHLGDPQPEVAELPLDV